MQHASGHRSFAFQTIVASLSQRMESGLLCLTTGTNVMQTETAPTANVPRSLEPKPRYGRELDPSQAALERHLLSYYISVVIPRMTIVHSTGNFFTSLYIPMAFQHTAVFDVTIACSAAYLAKSASDAGMAWQLRHVAAQRQSLAHQFIQKPLYNPDSAEWTSSLLEIITVLLFSIGLGAQGGDKSLRWMQRVNCVRELLKQHETSAAAAWTKWETACIRGHFRYYDFMSLIMEDALDATTRGDLRVQSGSFAHCSLTRSQPQAQTCMRPELDTDQQLLFSQETQTASTGINCLLGLSEDLFGIITRLRDLPDARWGHVWEQDFLHLQQELSNWKYDDGQASALEASTRLDLISLAECHRLTSMILLFRRCPSRHIYLPSLASQTMSMIQRISPKSTVSTALPPILFLAGAEVRSPDEMALCAARLTEASKEATTDVTPAEEVLQVLWKERLRNDARTDWLRILRARKWTFSLA
ncbi:hypothetical protein TgHK011_004928 [Trichoderma gracile]|nr:hypothetical protein TgHK011_004928 [Trichoderma gracile]